MFTQDKSDPFLNGRELLVMVNTEERWRQLCAEAAVEQDPQKLMELVKEINRLPDLKQQGGRPEYSESTQEEGKPPTEA
jgi:hypothetical protein